MSAEARYFRVGVFLFVGLALIVACVVVLTGGGLFERTRMFETYFTRSVQGLDVGSPVRYRGVQLGRVTEIGLVMNYYDFPSEDAMIDEGDKIFVRMELTPPEQGEILPVEALLARGMRARLASSGITGVAFIDLDFMGENAPPPLDSISWTPEYPYLPSAPSTIQRITSAAEKIFDRIDTLDVESIVTNVNDLLVDLRRAINDSDLPAVAGSARGSLDQAQATLVRAERLIDGSRYDLEASMENLRVTTENLRALTETLRNQPSLILRSGAPEKTSP